MTRGLYRNLAANTAHFDWLWERRHTQFDRGLYRHLAAYTTPFDWLRGRRHIQLVPVTAPPSHCTHAHFDWLRGRRHIQLDPGNATPPCSIKFGMTIYLLLVLLADFHTADFSAYSLWKLIHKFYKAGNLVGGKI